MRSMCIIINKRRDRERARRGTCTRSPASHWLPELSAVTLCLLPAPSLHSIPGRARRAAAGHAEERRAQVSVTSRPLAHTFSVRVPPPPRQNTVVRRRRPTLTRTDRAPRRPARTYVRQPRVDDEYTLSNVCAQAGSRLCRASA